MKGPIPCSFMLAVLLVGQPVTAATEEKAAGHYYRDSEVEFFVPCGSDNAFWVVGEEKVLQPLRSKMSELSKQSDMSAPHPTPPRPLYVEVTGHFEDNPNDEGITADYDGIYRIGAVLGSSPDSPAGCPVLVEDD